MMSYGVTICTYTIVQYYDSEARPSAGIAPRLCLWLESSYPVTGTESAERAPLRREPISCPGVRGPAQLPKMEPLYVWSQSVDDPVPNVLYQETVAG